MDEELEDFCICSLDIAEQVIQSVVNGFAGAYIDQQHDLIHQCHQVLEYAVLIEVFSTNFHDLVENLRLLIREMSSVVEESCARRSRGRPRIDIREEQLVYLVENRFRTKDLATIFDCSMRTVQRRMSEMGISLNSFTPIGDIHLDCLVQEIMSAYPHSGEVTVKFEILKFYSTQCCK